MISQNFPPAAGYMVIVEGFAFIYKGDFPKFSACGGLYIAVVFFNPYKWSRFRGTTLKSSFSKNTGSFVIIFGALKRSAQAVLFFVITGNERVKKLLCLLRM